MPRSHLETSQPASQPATYKLVDIFNEREKTFLKPATSRHGPPPELNSHYQKTPGTDILDTVRSKTQKLTPCRLRSAVYMMALNINPT